jgi:SAM-dependent methyltransferase
MASPDTSRMVELANKISSSVSELQELLAAKGAEPPSFDENSPIKLPSGLGRLQNTILDATSELHDVLLEPMSLLYKFSAVSNLISIDALCRNKIPEMIPAGGQMSYEEISKKSGLSLSMTRRLIRHSMAMHILREPEPGMVAHTKISKFLTIPSINAWIRLGGADAWPASAKTVDAMEKWPDSEEPNETGFSLANNTDKSIYEVLSGDPMRAMRFAASMQAFEYNPGYGMKEVPHLYDWASLGNVYMVDVGGSRGHVAIEVAKHNPGIQVLVQDMQMVVAGAENEVPEELKGRIEFMAQELFDAQTVQADVYFFRMIFHNWSDKYALKILQAQIPVLKPGSKILVQDAVMPEPGKLSLWRERVIRAMDLNMACFFNARERYLEEWKALLAAADERFVLERVIESEESLMAILEIGWKG